MEEIKIVEWEKKMYKLEQLSGNTCVEDTSVDTKARKIFVPAESNKEREIEKIRKLHNCSIFFAIKNYLNLTCGKLNK